MTQSARLLARDANAMDSELLRRVRARDVTALRTLYDRHSGLVYGLGLRILGDPAAAEDVVRDVFLQVWRRSERLDGEQGAITGWLVSMARSRAVDRRRASGAPPPGDPASLATGAPAELDESAFARALRDVAARALGALPEAQRVPLERAYFDGLSLEQIAGELGVEPATARARIRQGMLRLRDLLGEFAQPDLAADPEN